MRQANAGFPFAEDPAQPAVLARLLWSANQDPSVLTVAASPVGWDDPDAFDLSDFAAMAAVVAIAHGPDQVVLGDGYRRVRIDVAQGTLLAGPVRLRFVLEGFRNLDPKILTLRRFLALRKLGRFQVALHPRERFAPRWIAALRVHDGLRAGASQRAIAYCLYSGLATGSDWGDGSDFLRLRVQRLARAGRRMVSGGYRTLLR